MSDFHEILFPVDISYGSNGGPKWKTSVWAADSGFEARVIDWKNTRGEYDVSMGVRTSQQMDALTGFFYARRGRAFGFRFKDWNDFEANDIFLANGDYGTKDFQIVKTYSSPGQDGTPYEFRRDLKKIAWGSESGVTIDTELITRNPGDIQSYSINYNNGILTLGAPMWGAWYHGVTPVAPIDYRTVGEGSKVTAWIPAVLGGAGVPYDPTTAMAYQNVMFAGTNHTDGLRKVSMETAEEVAQATMVDMGIPVTGDEPYANNNMSGIIAVSSDGYVYLNVGGSSNGVAVMKVDGSNLQYVLHWGQVHPFGPNSVSSDYPSVPGCVSADNKQFIHCGIFGSIDLHSTENCARLKEVMRTGGVGNTGHVGVCQYRKSGFGIPFNRLDPTGQNQCRLYLHLGGLVGYEALAWGGKTGVVKAAMYDKKTGGIILFWENELGIGDAWVGLYHESAGGFRWKRRCHPLNTQVNMTIPLDGTMVWASFASTFGWCLWILNTEDGELRARRAPAGSGETPGNVQVYDPSRKLLMTNSNRDYVISTDVQGIALDPAEELRLGHVEFHIGVRFDTDHLNMKHEFWTHKSWDSIPLIEVRNWEDVDLD